MEQTKKGWFSCLLTYAGAGKRRLTGSVILSVISVTAGLLPYYCVFQLIEAFSAGALREEGILTWCGLALGAYLVKILCFGFSTMLSHYAAYHILEGLRLRVADRFLHAPLGEVTAHSIGEIKNLMVDKIEDIEPPLAHMIPEGMGHLALPVVSLIALARIDWRLALASLATVPLSLVCMILTFRISGKNFDQYVQSNTAMNSTIVEYIEGIEVIKAFGRAGTSYDKYAKAITDYRTFVVKWLSSTWVTFKLAFALFPSTLLGTLPMCLWLGTGGAITAAEAALMDRRQDQTTAKNTGTMQVITRASRHWMVNMMRRDPTMVTPEMKISSGPWWASSVMSKRSAVRRLMSWPVRFLS